MKKLLLIKSMFFGAAFLFIAPGCQKTSDAFFEEKQQNEAERHGEGNKNECRLVKAASEFGTDTYVYNLRGLLERWNIGSFGAYFTMEYDRSGRLSKSRYYDLDDVLLNTIKFIYKKNRVEKEIWYAGDTKDVADETFYTYNRKGKILKSESTIGDYYTIYTYTPDGDNVAQWTFYIGGLPFYKSEYTFLNRYKNPDLATPGVDYGFPYINAAVTQNKWYSTSEKATSYDEEGNGTVEYDQDPTKTIAMANAKNYVISSDFFDVIAQEWVHFVFDYENCGYCKYCNTRSAGESPYASTRNSRFNSIHLLMKGSSKSIKEQVKELRKIRNK